VAQRANGTWAEVLLSFVQRYPGVHLREIRRRLSIPIGTLDYHLYQLGRKGLIAVRFQGGYKCAFPETPIGFGTPIGEEEKRLLILLRQAVPRAILLQLYLDGPSPPSALADEVTASAANLAYYLRRLEAAGAILREGAGTSRTIRLADPKRIHEILLRYPPLPEDTVDRFLRFWSELHP
jgi:predicted transcriptional regulator